MKPHNTKQYDIDTIATDGIQVDNWTLELNAEQEARIPRPTVSAANGGANAVSNAVVKQPLLLQPKRHCVTLSTWDFAGQVTQYLLHFICWYF